MYQTPPSSAGATSWGRDPAGSENACKEVSEGDSVGKAFCDVGTGVEILASLVVEGGVADGGETGAVGVTDVLHPINARTIKIPRKDEDNSLLISGSGGRRVRNSRLRCAGTNTAARRASSSRFSILLLQCDCVSGTYRESTAMILSQSVDCW